MTQTYLGHKTSYYLGLPRSSHLHMLQTNGTAPSRERDQKKTFLGIKKNIFWRLFVRRVEVALIPGEIKKNIFRDQKKH